MLDDRLIAKNPEDVGVDAGRLEALFARAKRDVDERLLSSVQVAVAREGKLAGMRTFGTARRGDSSRPATDETLYLLFSCTKGIVGVATWALIEDGLLRLDERAADIVPEFGTNGKDAVTVEHLLLHKSGFPHATVQSDYTRAGVRPEEWSREKILKAMSEWTLAWEPGSRFEYHLISAHFVIAEIIQRRTGMHWSDYIRERLTGPMGLDDLYMRCPPEVDERFAEYRLAVGAPEPPPEGWGVEISPLQLLELNRPELRAIGLPGGGAVGGAAELAMFYQPLINGGVTADGTRILSEETIAFATTVRTTAEDRDPMYGMAEVNRGLSMLVAGDDETKHQRGFGRTVSPRAFGHPGAGGQISWGDPETGISLGYCLDGFGDWIAQARRITALSSLAGSCALAGALERG